MIVTAEYIEANKTELGAWTRSQLKALGAGWPTVKGWKSRACGTVISEKNARIFEAKEPSKKNAKKLRKEASKTLYVQSKISESIESKQDSTLITEPHRKPNPAMTERTIMNMALGMSNKNMVLLITELIEKTH